MQSRGAGGRSPWDAHRTRAPSWHMGMPRRQLRSYYEATRSTTKPLWAAAKLIIVSPVAEVAFRSFVGSLLAHLKMPLLLRLKPAEMSMRYAGEL